MSGSRSPRHADGGIEALLTRTRRQVAGFTLVAIVSVIAIVGVGTALAGSRAQMIPLIQRVAVSRKRSLKSSSTKTDRGPSSRRTGQSSPHQR